MNRISAALKPLVFLTAVASCSANMGSPKGSGGTPGGGSSTGGSNAGTGSTGATATGGATSSTGGAAGSTTSTGGTGGAGTGGAGTVAMTCPTVTGSATPLRRLTRFEYANTVKDLLKVDPTPANDLPADEVTDGFNNNAGILTVSSLHAEKYVLVSEALAKAAVKTVATLTGCDSVAKGEDACAMAFAKSFGRRAFRRPTTAADEQMLMTAYSAGKTGGSYAEGIEVMVRAALQSPDFLYRLETTTPANANAKLVPLSQFELGTRLSFLLWSTGPDDALLDAASRGELGTKAQVAAKTRDMLKDPKARVAIADFYNQWIGTSRLDSITKSTTLYPSYSTATRDAMVRELPAFVEYVLWKGDHTFNTLLTSSLGFVSGPLAQVYGVTAPAGSTTTPQMVTLPANQGRSGILTQAGFLAVQAHPDQTSPVLRGKFVRTKLLCQPPPPPPADANITPPNVNAAGTARERFSAHLTAASSCSGCHQLMDPIGLTFENFDGMGQYRDTEAGKPIDASGSIVGATDPNLMGAFTGVRALATKLASSDQVRNCVATQWFRFASGRNEADTDGCSITTLQDTFKTSGGDLVELIVGLTQTDAFWFRAPVTQ